MCDIPISSSPFRYLGYYICPSGLVSKMDEHTNNFVAKLHKWKYLGLSLLGKISVLSSYALPVFWYFAYLDTPTKLQISKINNAIKWFLWSSDLTFLPETKYKSKISLNRLSLPVHDGGLNLPCVKTKVNALQCSWFSRMFHSKSTALSIIQEALLAVGKNRKSDIPLFFSASSARIPLESNTLNLLYSSWKLFNKKINYFYLPNKGFLGEFNKKGKIIEFHANSTFQNSLWHTNRCDRYKGYLSKGNEVQVHFKNCYPINVSPNMAYLGPVNFTSAIEKVFRIYHPESNSYIKPMNLSCKDITFILNSRQIYTPSKVQERWSSTLDFSPTKTWTYFKKLKIRKKLKEFYYKVYNNTLPVMNNLKFLEEKCPVCLHQEETTHHLLFSCPQAAECVSTTVNAISFATGQKWNISESNWFNGLFDKPHLNIIVLLAKWSIWIQRCHIIFQTPGASFWRTFLLELEKLQTTYHSIPNNIYSLLQQYSCT